MSLLNDALRKKNKENRLSGDIPSLPMGSKISSGSKKKIYLIALVLISAAILGGLTAVHFIYLTSKAPAKPLPVNRPHLTKKGSLHKTYPAEILKKGDKVPAKNKMKLQKPDVAKFKFKPEEDETGTLKPDSKIEKAPVNKTPAVPQEKEKTIVKKKQSIQNNIKEAGNKKRTKKAGERYKEQKAGELFYQKGLAYHRHGSLDKAVKMYKEVLKKNPRHRGALFNLSAVYLAESSFAEAWSVLEKLKKIDPESKPVLMNCAIAKIGLGNYKQALLYLETVEKQKNAPLFMIYFHRGVAYSHMGNLSEALFWYKSAEKLHHDRPRMLFNMALAYDKIQNYQDAIKYYSKYLHWKQVPSGEKIEVEKRVASLKAYQIKPVKKVSDQP